MGTPDTGFGTKWLIERSRNTEIHYHYLYSQDAGCPAAARNMQHQIIVQKIAMRP
jgi:hypothetical protein